MDEPNSELLAGGAPVLVPAAAGAGRRHLAAQTRCRDLGCQPAIAAARASICLSNSGGG